jgi:hypothetical protein
MGELRITILRHLTRKFGLKLRPDAVKYLEEVFMSAQLTKESLGEVLDQLCPLLLQKGFLFYIDFKGQNLLEKQIVEETLNKVIMARSNDEEPHLATVTNSLVIDPIYAPDNEKY